MENLIIIPSRMASSRFPGKPLVKIDGIPMIQRVWQQAIKADLGNVYVACSESEIFNLINSLGGNAILTNPNLPSGTDRIYSAFKQIENYSKIEAIINLQGDMPLINPNHIKRVLDPLKNNYEIGTIVTTLKKDEVNNLNVTKARVEWKSNNIGEAKEFFREKNKITEDVFHHVGIYSYSIKSLEEFFKLPKTKNEKTLNLEQYRAIDAGLKIGVTYIPEIPPSVDTKEDLLNVENIIRATNEKN